MKFLHRKRSRTASLDKGLVLACWWIVTRSMVLHAVALALVLIFFASHSTVIELTPSYALILFWGPIHAWAYVLIFAALAWLFTRGIICILAGFMMTMWYWAFAIAFFIGSVKFDSPGTTITGWVTYGFLGWAWLCVTYVVWKDGEHIKHEEAVLGAISEMKEEIELHNGNGSTGQ